MIRAALDALVATWREAARLELPAIQQNASDEGYRACLLDCASQLAALATREETPAENPEKKRRKFMQYHNRWLGWGFDNAGPHRAEDAGVMFTAEGWTRPYERYELFEKYANHGGDREATEIAVIDKAMAIYDEMVRAAHGEDETP